MSACVGSYAEILARRSGGTKLGTFTRKNLPEIKRVQEDICEQWIRRHATHCVFLFLKTKGCRAQRKKAGAGDKGHQLGCYSEVTHTHGSQGLCASDGCAPRASVLKVARYAQTYSSYSSVFFKTSSEHRIGWAPGTVGRWNTTLKVFRKV